MRGKGRSTIRGQGSTVRGQRSLFLPSRSELEKVSAHLSEISGRRRTQPPISESDDEEEDPDPSSSSEEEEEDLYSSGDEERTPYQELRLREERILLRKELRWLNKLWDEREKEEEEGKEEVWTCAHCLLDLPASEIMEPLRVEHEREHRNGILKPCPYCEMSFRYEFQWREHLQEMR